MRRPAEDTPGLQLGDDFKPGDGVLMGANVVPHPGVTRPTSS